MFGDGALAFREFAMKEPLPLARIQDAIFEFLRGRDDAVMLGAQAVNAYAKQWRMTQDVDIMSTRAKELAEELWERLAEDFGIVAAVRPGREEGVFCVGQIREPKGRRFADVHQVASFPPSRRIRGVMVPVVEEVIAGKLRAYVKRKGKSRGLSDLRDLRALLLDFPGLKTADGPVGELLIANRADEATLREWGEVVAQKIERENDDDKFVWPMMGGAAAILEGTR